MGIKILMYNQKQIQKIKEFNFYEQDKTFINNKLEKFFFIYNLKIKIFAGISSILLLIFFFYMVSFGSIFYQSQGFFFIRLVLSLVLSMIYPLIFYFLSSFLRLFGLKYKKKSMYNSSLFIQYL